VQSRLINKWQLTHLILRLGYAIGLVIGALVVFLIARRPALEVIKVLQGEKAILEKSREVFPHFYVAHAFLIAGFALTGFTVCLRYADIRLRPYLRRYLPSYHDHKKVYLKLVAGLLFMLTIVLALLYSEWHYYHSGFYPGSFYQLVDFTSDRVQLLPGINADDRGMTTLGKSADNFSFGLQINRQGFLADFDYTRVAIDSIRKTGKQIVFVIGDSFVQGVTDGPHENTFVEILRKNNPGICICAFGVGGTDPANYRLIAEKYIPELKPDAVWLMMCAWNDLLDYERHALPGIPLLTRTNAGFIYLYPPPSICGNTNLVLSADSAYLFYRNIYSLFGRKDLLSLMARQSAVSTQLYQSYARYGAKGLNYQRDSSATYRCIKTISNLCDSNRAVLNIGLIPTPAMLNLSLEENRFNTKWVFRDMLDRVHFWRSKCLTIADFISHSDLHFNDKGNRKYAAFLQDEMFGLQYSSVCPGKAMRR
jgi:hypothetical protein